MDCGVKVAVDNAAFDFDRLYTYSVPDDMRQYAVVGARVLVPFGKSAPRMGVILETGAEEQGRPLKAIIDVERIEPLLTDELVKTISFLKRVTFCNYCDALKTVLPKQARLSANDDASAIAASSRAHLEDVFVYSEPSVTPRLNDNQRAVCELLKDNPLTFSEINEKLGVSRAVVNRLSERGVIEKSARQRKNTVYDDCSEERMPELTESQRSALEEINNGFGDPEKPDSALLFGVTASGKTLVYIKLIEKAVANGRGALVLVPEIAIATQMIYRLRALFGERVAIIHSALSDTERYIEWRKIRFGECDIVVGTRSAVFAPIKDLGIIIVDEEQESGYRSDQNPRYDALSVAAFRAKLKGAKLLLASATPSVETFYKAKTGVCSLVRLPERYSGAPLPKVRVVDMRRELLAGNSHYVSEYLKNEIAARLERKEQCVLLLNRRGYRTISMCCSCKKIVKCETCDTPLVLHKQTGTYVCHYCGRRYAVSETCSECGGKIKHTGIGTQKIEEDLSLLFPEARILRLDVDSVSRKNSVDEFLSSFRRREYDIIIGTQMIAKGLDFDNVTLAGVLSVDALLLMPSFRANERTFAMLTQIVGRSGRGDKTGEAIIQTIDPENEIMRLAAKQDYESFYENEIVSRRLHLYPPFCALCAVGFVSESENDAAVESKRFLEILIKQQREKHSAMPIRALGPAPMRVAYVNEIFRFRIIIKCRADGEFREFLRECIDIWSAGKNNKVRLFVDFTDELD